MKKLVAILLSAIVLFSFAACNNGAPLTDVRNQTELIGALEAGDKNIAIANDFDITRPMVINVDGVTINGNGHTLTIKEDISESYIINVTGSDVVMDGINISVTAEDAGLYVINASNSNTGFVFRNGSIVGSDWDATDSALASIAIGLNVVSSNVVSNSTFKDCFTPIYVNGADVTLTDIEFNSGINFNAVIDAAKLENLTLVESENWKNAKLNFEDVPGLDFSEGDPLSAIRTKFAEHLTVVPEVPQPEA